MSTIDQKQTVLVAMSGGVDSSVAAALLHDRGYDVIGVTMNLWDHERVGGNVDRDSGCCSIDTMDDARCVCSQLGIPHYVINLRDEFEAAVTDNFISEYMNGRTPNPCVRCNTYLKWGALLQKAEELGAEKIATGHYARSGWDATTDRYQLKRGLDPKKDQSYALWGIRQNGLAQSFFPVGDYTKAEIRAMARRFGLRTAEKSESQEICFIPDNDYGRFLRAKRPDLAKMNSGEIINSDGEVLGRHSGFPFYTIGQRKGLGLAMPDPVYVTEIQAGENRVTVGSRNELLHSGLTATEVNWVSVAQPAQSIAIAAQIRYNSPAVAAHLTSLSKGRIQVDFDEPQHAVTPGQSVVLYEGDSLLGGAIIDSYIK